MKIFLLLGLLLSISFVSAATQDVTLNVLRSGNITYVWVGDEAPIECITHSSGSCDIAIDVAENGCNLTDVLAEVHKDITHVNTTVCDLKAAITQVTGDMTKIPTATTLSGTIDTMKTEIVSAVSTRIDDKIASYAANSNLTNELRLNLTRCEGDKQALDVQNSNNAKKISDQDATISSLNTDIIIVLIMLGCVIVLSTPLLTAGRRYIGQ